MIEKETQMQSEFPEDCCICLDELDDIDDLKDLEEVKKMLQLVDEQVAEALLAVSTDDNPVHGYIRARSILKCTFDLLRMEETQKALDDFFLMKAEIRGYELAEIVRDYLKDRRNAES